MAKILVVDDDKVVRDLVKSILEGKYEITEAKDGLEALSLYEKNFFDLIITDINMPAMKGSELMRVIRKIDKEQCFLVMSDNQSLPFAAADADPNIKFLPEPFGVKELRVAVQKLLSVS